MTASAGAVNSTAGDAAPGGSAGELASTSEGAMWGFSRRLVFGISFLGGFQIMLLEMCGFRVLQTNLGSSVMVTGTLLTLIMLVLSAGYYAGGRIDRALPKPAHFLALLAASAVYTQVTTVVLLDWLAEAALSLRDGLAASPFFRASVPAALLAGVLYGPPVFVMSMISPYAIRRFAPSGGSDAGRVSGFFMSLSTVGSIAGTVLSSYLLIPFMGVPTTVLLANTLFLGVVLIALIGSAKGNLLRGVAVGTVVLTACGFLFGRGPRDDARGCVLHEGESHYGWIQVVEVRDASNRRLLEYHPSRVYTHSVLYPEEPLRQVAGLLYLVPGFVKPPETVLVLGSAAGGVLRQIEVAFPAARVVGVDVDPEVHRIARELFGVNVAKAELVTQDARLFLREETDRYGLIIVDLFSGETIPPHCVTLEFFRLVRARLAPGGAVFVNTNMNDVPHEIARAREPFRPIRHLQNTLREAGFPSLFENFYFHSVYAYPSRESIEPLRSLLLERLRNADLAPAIRGAAGLAAFTTAEVPDRSSYRPFTDDWTPDLLIELKSNLRAIYSTVPRADLHALHAGDSSKENVASVVLGRIRAEAARSGRFAAIRDEVPFIEALNGVDGAPSARDVGTAAALFQFGRLNAAPDLASARSAWAVFAHLYARTYQAARDNDHDALVRSAQALEEFVGRAGT